MTEKKFPFLRALSPLDGRYNNKINILSNFFSEQALILYRLQIEIQWLKILAIYKLPGLETFTQETHQFLDHLSSHFNTHHAQQIKTIETEINHDVKAVEYWIKQQINKHQHLKQSIEFVHFACTSEDINNLAYALMLKDARQKVIVPYLDTLKDLLTGLAHQYADIPMLSHTHGQTATPTTVGKEFANFAYRLSKAIKQIENVIIYGKMNGAVGNYNAHHLAYPELDWLAITRDMIENHLGLVFNSYTTQIEPHDFMAELFDAIARTNSILMDLTKDMWSYISCGYFKQKSSKKEVGSSTMPHKINPIDFENAEGNLGLSNALLQHFSQKLPISRMQRDLSDSTVLRNIGVAFGYAVLAYTSLNKGLQSIEVNTEVLEKELDTAWEVIAEPIQTIMRRHGLPNPYEQLKALTRGKSINRNLILQFIQSLPIPEKEKICLIKLTPAKYIGYASHLAKKI